MTQPHLDAVTDPTGIERPVRFNPAPRRANRRPRPWHRLAYIARRLPSDLEDLARDLSLTPGKRVLDYGCAEGPYRDFFAPQVEYLGADLPGNPVAAIELEGDGRVPIPDESVDAVLSTQVLEHTLDPELYLRECSRVLRPGGRLLLSTHGIMVYHPDPVDLWRWTCAGLERAVSEAGFEVVRFGGVMGLAATGIQLFQDAVYYRLPKPLRALLALCAQGLISIADRIESPESKSRNALVFALVAEKR
jgi:SAM-dependent methyltransferase